MRYLQHFYSQLMILFSRETTSGQLIYTEMLLNLCQLHRLALDVSILMEEESRKTIELATSI